MIAGIPAAIFIKKAVGYALAGLTIWGAAEMLSKDLDEKIKGLENDVTRLTITKQNAENTEDNAKKEEDEWKVKSDEADTAVSTARTNLKTAEKAESSAKSAYDSSVHYENWAYNDYMTHGASCSQSAKCSEGKRLYNNWQKYKKQLAADKLAWNKAKTDLKNKEADLSDAWDNYYTVSGTYGKWKLARQLAEKTRKAADEALDLKVADLAAKKVEKSINDATIQNAMGQTSSAISTLDDAETNYPNAWSEAMGDTDLAAQVQAVRNSWNEMTGGQ